MQNDFEENFGLSIASWGPLDLPNYDPTVSDDDYKPIWVLCILNLMVKSGIAGIRYKGNSSLQSANKNYHLNLIGFLQ